MRTNLAIIILAAGASRRMGEAKQLLQLGGMTLIKRAVKTALAVPSESVIVVLGARHDQIQKEIEDLDCHIVINESWEKGMGTSLSVGIEKVLAMEQAIDGCLILLADQPFLSARHLELLISTFVKYPNPIIATQHNATIGVPAIFDRSLFPNLLQLYADKGARQLIKTHLSYTRTISINDEIEDIDTPEDFAKAVKRFGEGE